LYRAGWILSSPVRRGGTVHVVNNARPLSSSAPEALNIAYQHRGILERREPPAWAAVDSN
jgi:hypothetical protein